jgi:hypothetical protein
MLGMGHPAGVLGLTAAGLVSACAEVLSLPPAILPDRDTTNRQSLGPKRWSAWRGAGHCLVRPLEQADWIRRPHLLKEWLLWLT